MKESRVIAYAQLGGFGARLNPATLQPGMGARDSLSLQKRGIPPWAHNSFYAVPKPILTYFGTAMSEPLLRQVVSAGIQDIRATLHTQPDTVFKYYYGRGLGEIDCKKVCVRKFLYEPTPLDTSGGIVKDVVSSIKEGNISPKDQILIVGGDIRAEINIAELVELHRQSNADITIALAEVPREEMYRFGAAVRKGDATETFGKIIAEDPKSSDSAKEYDLYGNLILNPDKMAVIVRFHEKLPKLTADKLIDEKGREIRIIDTCGQDLQEVIKRFGPGALVPTNRQNGSIVIMRAELIQQYAPLVFNLSLDASAEDWRDVFDENKNDTRYKFSDFGADWYMTFTGAKQPPQANPNSPIAKEQMMIIENLRKGLPAVFGYLMDGYWSDDGTLLDVLKAHFDILDSWTGKTLKPIPWPLDRGKVWQSGDIFSRTSIERLVEDGNIQVTGPVFIGRDVDIAPGAKIGPYAVIGDGWYVAGEVNHSVLYGQKDIDRLLQKERGWERFKVHPDMTIRNSVVASGFELLAVNKNGIAVPLRLIESSVVVSNGSHNVIWPINA